MSVSAADILEIQARARCEKAAHAKGEAKRYPDAERDFQEGP